MTVAPQRRRAERACSICGEPYRPKKDNQQTCGLVCRQKLIARRKRPGLVAAAPRAPFRWPGVRVRLLLDDPRCGDNRQGVVTGYAIVAGRPLLTVKLDKGGWPGGNYGGHPPAGWYVELRLEEVWPV